MRHSDPKLTTEGYGHLAVVSFSSAWTSSANRSTAHTEALRQAKALEVRAGMSFGRPPGLPD
jgi:hypothetical protein